MAHITAIFSTASIGPHNADPVTIELQDGESSPPNRLENRPGVPSGMWEFVEREGDVFVYQRARGRTSAP